MFLGCDLRKFVRHLGSYCHATLCCILEDVILIISVVSASDLRDLSFCRRVDDVFVLLECYAE
jgi:hypothetical protein